MYGALAPVIGIPPPPLMRQGGSYASAPAGVLVIGVVVGGEGGDVWRCGTRHCPRLPCGLPRTSGEGRPLAQRPAQAGSGGFAHGVYTPAP